MKKIFILFAVIMSVIMIGCEMPSSVQIPSTPSISSSTEIQNEGGSNGDSQNDSTSDSQTTPLQNTVITLNFNLAVTNDILRVYVGNIASNNRQYVAKAIECYIRDTLHYSMYNDKLNIENADNSRVFYNGNVLNISNGHTTLKNYMSENNNSIPHITVDYDVSNGTYSLTNPNGSN